MSLVEQIRSLASAFGNEIKVNKCQLDASYYAIPHISRTLSGGGAISGKDILKANTENLAKLGLLDYVELGYMPECGNVVRTDGTNNFVTKGYSLDGVNDLVQATSTNQPYLDKVSPTERLSIKNPNGSSNFMAHPAISFGANDEWSVEVVFNITTSNGWFSTYNREINSMLGLIDRGTFGIYNKYAQNQSFGSNFNHLNGKDIIVTYVAYGNNALKLYVNGVYAGQVSIDTTMLFNTILSEFWFSGSIFSYHIFSKALTPQQVADRATILRSIFPEIPSVQIGSQTWAVRNYEAVCTPMGNLIPEMVANGSVDIVTGGDFESGLVGNIGDGSGSLSTWILNNLSPLSGSQDALLSITASSDGLFPRLSFPSMDTRINKYYKLSFSYKVNSGSLIISGIYDGGNFLSINDTITGQGLYKKYIKATGGNGITTLYLGNSICNIQIDNYSIQELGWADSQELFDGIFAQTTGTDEQKMYAAVKAAAMWCHYNNDPALGVVYGKLYNWFAVKLLQMDIDYYNAANPTTPWGWRVPTQADFQALSTYLGGDAVSGGKLKMAGTQYWNSPNIGATNESGFSAIQTALRTVSGTYGNGLASSYWYNLGTGFYELNTNNNTVANNSSANPIYGFSLRLIKQ